MNNVIAAIIVAYMDTGEFGTRGIQVNESAWEYCIKTVDGTDTDMVFCDHKFDPNNELAELDFDYDDPEYAIEYFDGR
jgi:hypothetical protein